MTRSFVAMSYVQSISPTSGSLTGGNLVSIRGDGFKDRLVVSARVSASITLNSIDLLLSYIYCIQYIYYTHYVFILDLSDVMHPNILNKICINNNIHYQ